MSVREAVKRASAHRAGKAAALAGKSSLSHPDDIQRGTIFYDDWCDGYREGERANPTLLLLREAREEMNDALAAINESNAKGGPQITGSTVDDLIKMVGQIDVAIGPEI